MNLVNVLQRGRTALHFAAEKNSLAIVELLIRSGADVNAKDEVSHHALYFTTVRMITVEGSCLSYPVKSNDDTMSEQVLVRLIYV